MCLHMIMYLDEHVNKRFLHVYINKMITVYQSASTWNNIRISIRTDWSEKLCIT